MLWHFGMSFHILYRARVAIFCIDIGNEVPFLITTLYDWELLYMSISFFTYLYYFVSDFIFAYIMSNAVVDCS